MKVGRSVLLLLVVVVVVVVAREAYAKKSLDPYKVLGVDRNASQRDIQKAFHKLSLQYHPDKNKGKGAQEKFAEINNAYDILSDEEKRKNYDLYGDEKVGGFNGRANFGGGNFGGHEGYSFFTTRAPGSSQFNFKPGGWHGMGGQGNSFSFSFGGNPGGDSSFGFDIGDIFSSFFGGQGKGGGPFGSFSSSAGSKSGGTSSTSLRSVNAEVYNKEILDQGLTWLLLFYTPSSRGNDMMEAIVEDVSNSLQGAIKAGSINCHSEKALCDEFGVRIWRSARIFVYSYSAGGVSLVEYNDELDARSLKNFCTEYFPRFSKRVDIGDFDFPSNKATLPEVLLLSTKTDTPVIWRALSGLYRNRFVFYDAEVQNIAGQKTKRLGVDALPAIVGRMVNGEMHVLKNGVIIKDLKTGVSELRTLLEDFEKKNKKAAQRSPSDSGKGIPHLTSSNMEDLCGDKASLCIIGAFRSPKGKDRIESMLSLVSQKTLTRRQNQALSSSNAISYVLLDANKQPSFLKSFDKSGFKKSDLVLMAYKPRKDKFAAFTGDNVMALEEVEVFLSSALNGDVRFSKIQQKPVIR